MRNKEYTIIGETSNSWEIQEVFQGSGKTIIVVNRLSALSRYRESLKKIFCVTLNGAIDFNDYEITRLFRFDHEIKTRKEIFRGNTVLSVWTEDQIIHDMEWKEIPTIKITTESHSKQQEGTFGLMVYTGLRDNPSRFISNPEEYRSS